MMELEPCEPIGAHLDFLRKDEVLNRRLIFEYPVPGTTTVVLHLAEVLRTEQDPNPRDEYLGMRMVIVAYLRHVSVIFC